jgi:hypothetical protein
MRREARIGWQADLRALRQFGNQIARKGFYRADIGSSNACGACIAAHMAPARKALYRDEHHTSRSAKSRA